MSENVTFVARTDEVLIRLNQHHAYKSLTGHLLVRKLNKATHTFETIIDRQTLGGGREEFKAQCSKYGINEYVEHDPYEGEIYRTIR